ncbi:MAG: Ribose transport system permease protein RbsC [Firmicutes bacterium ADurb.Bin467]|nr:MAG: Ribose transport system permease protein RbsC [Firmicutes bacterium ADurb.Bin467]
MENRKNGAIRSLIAQRGVGQVLTVLVGLIVLCAVFSFINPNFFGVRNVGNLLRQIAPYIIVGIGQGYVLITGNIDLSIGSVLGMSCMMSATLMCFGVNPLFAIAITLASSLVVGILNGELVARCKLPPFIATLGTMTICRGLAQLVNNNRNTDSIEKQLGEAAKVFRVFFYQGFVRIGELKIYNTFVIAIAVWIVFNFILSKTRTGRHVYAVGSNREASHLSGVNVARTIIKAYVISAFCACLVGLIQCATTGTGTMDAGTSYEMYGVAVSVIGGISTLGGTGILAAVLVGSSVWAVLDNGLQLAGSPVALRNIIIGVIVIASVLIDVVRRSGKIRLFRRRAA